jgi:hypothetical protein
MVLQVVVEKTSGIQEGAWQKGLPGKQPQAVQILVSSHTSLGLCHVQCPPQVVRMGDLLDMEKK